MYDVADLLPVDGLDPGSTLLVVGPPMTGKRLLGMRLLERGFDHGEAAAIVTTDSSAADVRDLIAQLHGDSVESLPLGVVDCVGEMQQTDGLGPLDHRVTSPADLTGIGMELTDLMEELYTDHSTRLRMGLFSLTTMSMYASAEQVIRFIHVLSNRISEAAGVGFVVAHSDTMDDEHLQRLRSFVDGVVEVREADDGESELRVVGVDDGPTDWVSFSSTLRRSRTVSDRRSEPMEVDVPESLRAVMDEVQMGRPTLTVCNYDGSDETLSEIERYFDRHNVAVQRGSLDGEQPRSFALLHRGPDLLASENVQSLRHAIELDAENVDTFGERHASDLLTRLEESVFGASAANKRLLIDVSHTIELLAERNGGGRLHAGFQRFSRLVEDDRSARIYRKLSAAGTDVHVYGVPDADLDFEGVTTHGDDRSEIADSWFVVYDGNGNPDQQAALLAFQIEGTDEYNGFWTYDSDIAGRLDAYLTETYVDSESTLATD
jgi:KaiC/GvpD/RAD55 family RecA-like ATPase